MADAAEVSPFVVWKSWKEYGLKPHVVRTFKVSNDPHFAEKVEEIVGLSRVGPRNPGVVRPPCGPGGGR
jgi:hypothetical protein